MFIKISAQFFKPFNWNKIANIEKPAIVYYEKYVTLGEVFFPTQINTAAL